MHKVDETIDVICDWIQEELKTNPKTAATSKVAEITKALAELVAANQNQGQVVNNYNCSSDR